MSEPRSKPASKPISKSAAEPIAFFPDSLGISMKSHRFSLPLDYQKPAAGDISIFVREFRHTDGEKRPYVIYLQGGPGYPSPRFTTNSSFLKPLLERFNVLLLDQRGTGLSSRISAEDLRPMAEAERAQFLSLFRAPNIIQDVIALESMFLTTGEKWLVLGQSFGGFCLAHYLATKPDRIAAGLFTGGIPPLAPIDTVHEHTYAMLAKKVQRFNHRYPETKDWLATIIRHIQDKKPTLATGDTLTLERLRQLGMWLGRQDGAQTLYYFLETCAGELAQHGRLSFESLGVFNDVLNFVSNPLYGLLIEPCYADAYAPKWSAQRVGEQRGAFADTVEDFQFTGEMVFPWVYEQHSELAFLKGTADALAHKDDWQPLYNLDALKACEVPLAAAIYEEDSYVDKALSMEMAGLWPHLRTLITNEMEHGGLRTHAPQVVDTLTRYVGY